MAQFCWESYHTALDTLENNARLEVIYQVCTPIVVLAHSIHTYSQQVAALAFRFCTRKLEFRRLCETPRLHLANVAKYANQPSQTGRILSTLPRTSCMRIVVSTAEPVVFRNISRGRSSIGAIMYALLLSIPIITAVMAVAIFRWSFYGIFHNEYGVKPKENHTHYFPILGGNTDKEDATPVTGGFFHHDRKGGEIIGWPEDPHKRRKVLIATLEYEIIDWKLKVK